MRINNLNSSSFLIPIQSNTNIIYDSIIAILDANTVEKSVYFQSKKIVTYNDKCYKIRSYIYCKGDYLIATQLDVITLKQKISICINNELKSFWDYI